MVLAHFAKGASPFLLGCNAVVPDGTKGDATRRHAEDTVRGGCDINDADLAEELAERAPEAIRDLTALGVPFAKDGDRPRLRHLSGNRFARSFFVAQGTGTAILDALGRECRRIGVRVLKGLKVATLLRDQDAVVGAILFERDGGPVSVRAGAVVVALGGLGRAYEDSTYPADVAATSYALMLRAGAAVIDMEFVQFEPTVTVFPSECTGMEMPTAMLGDGAQLLNVLGERFMLRHNPDGGEKGVEKARLSLFIQQEIDEGRGFPDRTVAFDSTVLPADVLEGYVTHRQRLLKAGVDPAKTPPRVRPAAHSMMGGVAIDRTGWTGVPGLFAAGEATGGVHGASRLAGNGGTDIVVFGDIAGTAAAQAAVSDTPRDWSAIERGARAELADIGRSGTGERSPEAVTAAVRRTLSGHVGIHRDGPGLEAAVGGLDSVAEDVRRAESANEPGTLLAAAAASDLLLSARIVATAALLRTESRGAHQRRDHPERDDATWRRHIAFRAEPSGEIAHEYRDIRNR